MKQAFVVSHTPWERAAIARCNWIALRCRRKGFTALKEVLYTVKQSGCTWVVRLYMGPSVDIPASLGDSRLHCRHDSGSVRL